MKSTKEKITVYSPDSNIKNIAEFAGGVFRDFAGSFDLGWRLFVRDLKGQNRKSILGYAWIVIPILLNSLVWIFLNGQKVIKIENVGIPYPAFVLISTVLWTLFSESMTMPLQMYQSSMAIIGKINFPKEALLWAGMMRIGFNFIFQLLLIIVVFLVFRLDVSFSMLLAPLGIVLLVGLGITIGLLLLPAGMLYTDIGRALTIINRFWMLLTPVIYPYPRGDTAAFLNRFNPVSPVLTTTRDWLIGGQAEHVAGFAAIGCTTLALFICGIILFRLAIPFITERAGD